MKKKLATAIGLIALGTVFDVSPLIFLWENFQKNLLERNFTLIVHDSSKTERIKLK